MKFDITVLIILGFSIKWSKGYVAEVNPKLVRTELTTIRPNVDFKTNHQKLVESTSQRNLISTTTSRYDDSRIIFPSPSNNHYTRRDSQETQEQWRDENAIRAFPTNPGSSNQNPREVRLSRFSSGYLFERDDDDVRPIWSK